MMGNTLSQTKQRHKQISQASQKICQQQFDQRMYDYQMQHFQPLKKESLQELINKIVFQNLGSNQQDEIIRLFKIYDKKNLKFDDWFPKDLNPLQVKCFQKCQALSANVYSLIRYIFVQVNIIFPDQSNKQIDQLRKIVLSKHGLTLSLNRYIFKQKQIKDNVFLRRYYDDQEDDEEEVQQNKYISQIFKTEQNLIFNQFINFMISIGLLETKQNELSNIFLQKLQRIKSKQHKYYFIQHYSLGGHHDQVYANLQFYKNQRRIRSGKMTIQHLQNKKYNYEFLENVHDYIQWMFPNHYGSGFNSSAQPLSYIQSEIFRQDLQIGFKIIKSISIYFDFIGIHLSLHDGQLYLINQERAINAIVKYTHNHLRIMRVLACISVIGFRQIALNLINFLDYYTKQDELLMRERSSFKRQWQIYGNKTLKIAKKRCFLQNQNFPADHPIIQKLFTQKKIVAQESFEMIQQTILFKLYSETKQKSTSLTQIKYKQEQLYDDKHILVENTINLKMIKQDNNDFIEQSKKMQGQLQYEKMVNKETQYVDKKQEQIKKIDNNNLNTNIYNQQEEYIVPLIKYKIHTFQMESQKQEKMKI